ncbi:MAG: DinB family protein [Dehalococcoidia bacterium]|nr:DinB family protein [Dehalococcoidia bacterium]
MPDKTATLAELTDVFRRNRAALMRDIERVPEVLIHTPPFDGGWSVAQTLAHILAADTSFIGRVDRMLTNPGKDIPMMQAVADAPLHPSVSRTTRRQFVEQLKAGEEKALQCMARLTPADLAVSGKHPRFGVVTVESVLKHLAEHAEEHRRQIVETAERVAAQPPPSAESLSLAIERSLAAFMEAFARVPDRHLHSVPKPGEWTPAQIAVHLAAAERGYLHNMSAVRATPGCTLGGVPDAANAPVAPDVPGLTRGQIVDRLAEARQTVLAYVAQLKPEEMRQYGVNPTRGLMSVEFMLRREASHPLDHRMQLLETLDMLAKGAGAS